MVKMVNEGSEDTHHMNSILITQQWLYIIPWLAIRSQVNRRSSLGGGELPNKPNIDATRGQSFLRQHRDGLPAETHAHYLAPSGTVDGSPPLSRHCYQVIKKRSVFFTNDRNLSYLPCTTSLGRTSGMKRAASTLGEVLCEANWN